MSEILRSFRRNAVHTREALAFGQAKSGRLEFDGGYLQDTGRLERYKRLSIPVRRALNPTDRASFAAALAALAESGHMAREGLAQTRAAWQQLQHDLDTVVGLGGEKIARRQILTRWLDAVAFHDARDHNSAYEQLIARWGNTAEGAGVQLTEEVARIVLMLDEVAAAELGEPVILPPPVKTPPPPADPDDRWWRRWRSRPSRS